MCVKKRTVYGVVWNDVYPTTLHSLFVVAWRRLVWRVDYNCDEVLIRSLQKFVLDLVTAYGLYLPGNVVERTMWHYKIIIVCWCVGAVGSWGRGYYYISAGTAEHCAALCRLARVSSPR